ncbi:MAG: hypothetical protein ABSB69_04560 [Solirubrobacteraceae bacterium]|jgi:hypothetical protein
MTPREAFELGAAVRTRHDAYTSDSSDHVRVGVAIGIRLAVDELSTYVKPPQARSEFNRGLGAGWQHAPITASRHRGVR